MNPAVAHHEPASSAARPQRHDRPGGAASRRLASDRLLPHSRRSPAHDPDPGRLPARPDRIGAGATARQVFLPSPQPVWRIRHVHRAEDGREPHCRRATTSAVARHRLCDRRPRRDGNASHGAGSWAAVVGPVRAPGWRAGRTAGAADGRRHHCRQRCLYDRIASKHGASVKKRLKHGAVVTVSTDGLSGLADDGEVGAVSGDGDMRSQLANATESTGAAAAWAGKLPNWARCSVPVWASRSWTRASTATARSSRGLVASVDFTGPQGKGQ